MDPLKKIKFEFEIKVEAYLPSLIHHMTIIEWYLRFYSISKIWIPYRISRLFTACVNIPFLHASLYFCSLVLLNLYFQFHFGPLFKTGNERHSLVQNTFIVSSNIFFLLILIFSPSIVWFFKSEEANIPFKLLIFNRISIYLSNKITMKNITSSLPE